MMKLNLVVQGSAEDQAARTCMTHWEHDAGSLQFWRASSNFVYRYTRAGTRYYLRFASDEDRTRDQLEAELDFLTYLQQMGIPTVVPVSSAQGHRIVTIPDTPIGTLHAVTFTEATGHSLYLPHMTPHHLEQWGRSLALLHQQSAVYSPPDIGLRRPTWEDALEKVRSVLAEHPAETDATTELLLVEKHLHTLPRSSSSFGLIHYDFELDNLFWNDRLRQFTAIDFDDALYHWYVMDIVSATRELGSLPADAAARAYSQFLQGYRSVMPIDESLWEQRDWFERFQRLVRFARVLRSLDDAECSATPAWWEPLLAKLTHSLDEDRRRFRVSSELAVR
ncbi:phosphotransferase enzyme family protein [Paenibacillus koleovorans]|uniref:phosphotransferase enzyme family protein n=1 Tax=Paenibacillus koleovorans TaxID=121608 RepID=UPI0013E30E0F|nr:phosphotransferase [Paenibacillus koleovorans]